MEMQQVIYFQALCEELNFTRAARRCEVSQPSLTRAIRLLEEEFGGILFNRERVNTHLSELGSIVKPHLDQILQQADLANQKARSFHDLTAIRLKLGVMCTIAPTDIVQLLTGLGARHPGIQIEINDASAPEIDQDLQQGDLEIAILCKAGGVHEPQFHYMPLFRERFMIVTSRNHKLAVLDTIRVADLKGTPYLQRVNCEYADYARSIFHQQGVFNETAYRSDRDDWILAMAAAGMGYSFMPEHCVNHADVVAKPLVDPEFWREINLVTVRGRPHSPAVGALVHEAMRSTWTNGRALAVQAFDEQFENPDR
jgi:LysR family transcriptional regulator, hydrogen peroxide-inducible genes activator